MLVKPDAPKPKKIGVRVWRKAIPQFNLSHQETVQVTICSPSVLSCLMVLVYSALNKRFGQNVKHDFRAWLMRLAALCRHLLVYSMLEEQEDCMKECITSAASFPCCLLPAPGNAHAFPDLTCTAVPCHLSAPKKSSPQKKFSQIVGVQAILRGITQMANTLLMLQCREHRKSWIWLAMRVCCWVATTCQALPWASV